MRGKLLNARAAIGTVLLTTALVVTGCADSPLADARRSPQALARSALEALKQGEADGLDALRVTRDEYETLIWPVLPDRTQMPFEFVWSVTDPRSRKARRVAMAEYEGVPLELDRVELGTDVERYEELTLYRRSRMWVRRTDTGAVGILPLMDTLVEMGGGWKFMNFVDDV